MIIFHKLLDIFKTEIDINHLENEIITVKCEISNPFKNIKTFKQQNFPMLNGKETTIECIFRGHKGQASTSFPATYNGTLKEILYLDICSNSYDRAIFIAVFNCITSYLHHIPNTIHCQGNSPNLCAYKFKEFISKNFSNKNIALIGYHKEIITSLSSSHSLRVLDLDSELINKNIDGTTIEDGISNFSQVMEWADVILCTGSTLSNGTIVNFLNLDIPIFFYGTTISGIAYYFNLPRLCFESKN